MKTEKDILFEIDGFYVTNEGDTKNPSYHLWKPNLTHATVDSAYNDISLGKVRCKYLALNKKNN